MLSEMSDDEPDPRSGAQNKISAQQSPTQDSPGKSGPVAWFKGLIKGKASNSNTLREALEDYIEDIEESSDESSIDTHHELVTNVLQTHEKSVHDVMIPRADIIAIDIDASYDELKFLLIENQFSRIPVYRDTLDGVVGAIHIKDVLAKLLTDENVVISDMVRDIEIVSPSMPVLDLLHMMRQDRKHMALVMDEFGGIDGLVTINDLIEVIVGEIDDEFDEEDQPHVVEKQDGSLIVDGRMDIDEFEERYGRILTAEQREDVDTLGGLALSVAGRVPARGEILRHDSGMAIEVMDADRSRVNRLRLRNLPPRISGDEV